MGMSIEYSMRRIGNEDTFLKLDEAAGRWRGSDR